MDAIAPSDWWLKGRVVAPRSEASRLLASRPPSRTANCAVGAGLPSYALGTSAQSPSAQKMRRALDLDS